jgi:hypothetical protein
MKHALPERLTSTPSALILAALADLEQVENDPRYRVDMGTWHSPNGTCAVCFAGSVIAFGLGAQPDEFVDPDDLDEPTSSALYALDAFRSGFVQDGLDGMDLSHFDWPDDEQWSVPIHSRDRDGFFNAMSDLAGILAAEGL